MKRVMLAMAYVIVAIPIFAQEVDLGLGGDASSLLNLPAPRGNAPARSIPPVDRLIRLRELLAATNLPLAKEQEAALNSLLTAEIPAMRRTLQERIAELQKTRGRGADPRNLPGIDELAPEIMRLNDRLLGKIAGAPGLNPQQQAFVKKLYEDQVKSRGGFDAIKLTLENAGVPFSPEQIAQIQPLFDEENEANLQLLKGAAAPDKAKIDQLQRETLARVIRLLTPPQRSALVAK